MSQPITCTLPIRQDTLFYVLYGCSDGFLRQVIDDSVINIAREYPADGVRDALHSMRPAESDSLNKLRAKMFMLLNEDEALRRKISEPQVKSCLIQPLCYDKARGFYTELYDHVMPWFIQNETITLDALVDRLREAYLNN
jgi:hypothetical protein